MNICRRCKLLQIAAAPGEKTWPPGENILAMYLDENPTEIPWDAIRYLIAEARNTGSMVPEKCHGK